MSVADQLLEMQAMLRANGAREPFLVKLSQSSYERLVSETQGVTRVRSNEQPRFSGMFIEVFPDVAVTPNGAAVSNVSALPGCRTPTLGPNGALVRGIRDALARAERGELQSFIGTGFCADGCRFALWGDTHDNVYEMAGALTWLQAEYIHRHAEAKD